MTSSNDSPAATTGSGSDITRQRILTAQSDTDGDAMGRSITPSRRSVLGTLAAVAGAAVPIGSVTASGRNEVPEPSVEGPITGGMRTGEPQAASLVDPSTYGYVEEEYFISGTAIDVDGNEEPYKTRILVERPTDPDHFNGTVVLNWANVAFDFDVPTLWVDMYDYLMRAGYACVILTGQEAGVEFLTEWDPERYPDLQHPGDEFSVDIFSQAAKLVGDDSSAPGGGRPSSPPGRRSADEDDADPDPLDGLAPDVVVGGGQVSDGWREFYFNEYLVAYPEVDVFDGFLFPTCGRIEETPVPVMTVNSESEHQRGPYLNDGENLCIWEVAGAAHINWWKIQYGLEQSLRDRTGYGGQTIYDPIWSTEIAGHYGERHSGPCPMNFYPMRHVVRAALDSLDRWIRQGEQPGSVFYERDYRSYLLEDDHGNVRGGVRLPVVDAPVATYDGRGDCDENAVGGETTQFDPATLAELYPTNEAYVEQFRESAAAAVDEGWLLETDAAALVERAAASPIGSWGSVTSGDSTYDRDLQRELADAVTTDFLAPADPSTVAARLLATDTGTTVDE